MGFYATSNYLSLGSTNSRVKTTATIIMNDAETGSIIDGYDIDSGSFSSSRGLYLPLAAM